METPAPDRSDALGAALAEIRPGLDLLGLPACVLDRDSRYRYANQSYVRFGGVEAADLHGKTVARVFGVPPHDDRHKAYARALTGETLTVDRRTVSGPHKGEWVRAHYTPVQRRGAVVGVCVILVVIQHLKDSEAALAERERQLSLITDSTGFPMTYIDRQGVVRFANQPSLDWAGLAREDMVGLPYAQLAPADVLAASQPMLDRAFAGERVTYEREALWPGREKRRIRGHMIPDLDEGGAVRGVLVVVMDIETDHRLKESLLARTRELQLVTENVGVPMAYIDRERRFRFVNTRGLDWRADVPTEAAVGKLDTELYSPDVLAQVNPYIEAALAGRKVVYERQGRQADGSLRWIRVNLVPDVAPDGQVRGIYSIVIDIDEDKRLREALERQERQLRFYADNIPDAIAFIGPDFRYQFVNKSFERIRGQDASEILGRTVEDLLGAEATRQILAPYVERLRRGEPCAYERFVGPPGGEQRWVLVRLDPVRDPDGAFAGYYVIATDIHDLKLAQQSAEEKEKALRRAQSILGAHFDNTPLAVVEWGPDLRVARWTGRAEALFGWNAAEVLGQPLEGRRFVFEEDEEEVSRVFASLVEGTRAQATHLCRNYRADGAVIWVEWHHSALREEGGNLLSILSLAQDVSSRIQAEQRLQFMATHDGLTGLANRVLLMERLKSSVARAQRAGSRIAVMFLDLDHFKDVNDSLGHRVGDELLKALARRIRATLRQSDLLARISGDEFVAVLDDMDAERAPEHVAQKILDDVMRPFRIDGHEVRVSASLGFATFPSDGRDAEVLLKNADAAMYQAKEFGRNGYRAFSRALADRREQKTRVESLLLGALRGGEFSLHYQPVLSVSDNRVIAAEALLRWNDPDRGLVMPHAFVTIAEEAGLGRDLGRWVFVAAAEQAAAWHRGRSGPPVVSVNVSAGRLRDAALAQDLADILQAAGCEPGWLTLEVSEAGMVRDIEGVGDTIGRLHRLGVGLAIDNFGTGYSSLGHLRHLPVGELKIDATFVGDVDMPARMATGGAAIVAAVIGMARGMGLSVVAKGVERESQLAFLTQQGCEAWQGYFATPPLPAPEFESWVRRHDARTGKPVVERRRSGDDRRRGRDPTRK